MKCVANSALVSSSTKCTQSNLSSRRSDTQSGRVLILISAGKMPCLTRNPVYCPMERDGVLHEEEGILQIPCGYAGAIKWLINRRPMSDVTCRRWCGVTQILDNYFREAFMPKIECRDWDGKAPTTARARKKCRDN